jgi:5-hydroxyisourate hydrolase-like protein (transthyretin family)
VVGVVRGDEGPIEARVEALRLAAPERVFEARGGLGALMCMSALVLPPADPGGQSAVAVACAGVGGRYRLAGLAPGHYRLRATTPRGAVGDADLWIPVPGAVIEKDIVLGVPAMVEVRGRIRHADGRPFRGRVAAFPIGMAIQAASLGVETDAGGRFCVEVELPSHGLRGLWIGALAPQHSVVLWPLADRQGPLDLVVDEGVRTVEGAVVEEGSGRPVPEAEVFLCGDRDEGGTRRFERVTTDADGRFRLTLVGPGARGVFVRSEGHGHAWTGIPEGGKHVSVPPLRLAGRIRGRVVWPDGVSRAQDLRVWAWLEFEGAVRDLGVAAAAPDEDGRFDLGTTAPCRAIVYAVGGGWISQGVPEYVGGREDALPVVEVAAGEAVEVQVPVVRAGSVRGRVTGPDGKPVAGALLRVDIVHGAGQRLGGRPPGTHPDVRHAATGADGTYVISSLIPGIPYSVEVAALGLATVSSDVVRADAGESEAVDFQLEAAGSLVVTVLDEATGQPVAGASIYLSHRLRTSSSMHGGACDTDRCGRCRFDRLRAEPMEVAVHADGYRSVTRIIEPPTHGGSALVELSRVR